MDGKRTGEGFEIWTSRKNETYEIKVGKRHIMRWEKNTSFRNRSGLKLPSKSGWWINK